MAPKNVILASLLAFCVSAYGQTRSLLVNPSGVVQYTNTVEWQGALSFGTNATAQAVTRSNLSLGLPALTNATGAGLLSDIGGVATNGDAVGLTNFPSIVLQTNSSDASFPPFLLRTNGSAAALTNFPTLNQNTTGTASNVTGVVEIANGGTGTNSAAGARIALELGSAATNDATAFQPASTNLTALASGDGSSLTNVTVTDAGTLTNFPAELLRTNGDAAGLTNFPADLLRTNGDAASLTNFPSELLRTNGDGSGLSNVSVDLTTVLPAYSNNAAKVLAVTTNESGVEWIAVSNTVTDAASLTNFPAYLLQTNGDAVGLTNFPAELLRTNGNAGALTNFPSELLRTNGDGSGLTNLPSVGITKDGPGAVQFNYRIENSSVITNATSSGGSVALYSDGLNLNTSSSNNAVAFYSAHTTIGSKPRTVLVFSNPYSIGTYASSFETNFAEGNVRFMVGVGGSVFYSDPTNAMVGWRFQDQVTYAVMHNGTNYSEPFTNTTALSNTTAWLFIESKEPGVVSWYADGQLIGTSSNGPTGDAGGTRIAISITNDTGGATTSGTFFRVYNTFLNFQ